ncbi:amino acid adenylation domain-containing protein [Paenibacillus polymyxa]|uniref:amino acid adenylation domain-containing protein n=1 Tax=Paenibacillus polymyxa TaxID=1406 RepID=UPI002ED2484F|nr:amino acid adenylation domain-containing protein [Paenibacillus polymyxa]
MNKTMDISNIKRIVPMTGAQKRLSSNASNAGKFGKIRVEFHQTISYEKICAAVSKTIHHYDVLQSVIYDKDSDKMVQLILYSMEEKFVEPLDFKNKTLVNFNHRSWRVIVDEQNNEIFFLWHQAIFDLPSVINILQALLHFYFSADHIEEMNMKVYQKYYNMYLKNVESGSKLFQDTFYKEENNDLFSKSLRNSDILKSSEWNYLDCTSDLDLHQLNKMMLFAWGTVQQSYTNNNIVLMGVVNNQRGIEKHAVGNFTNIIPLLFTCEGDLFVSDIMEYIYDSIGTRENQQIDIYDVCQYMKESLWLRSVVTIIDESLVTKIQSTYPVTIDGPNESYYSYQCPSDIIFQVIRKSDSQIAYRFLWNENLFSNEEVSAFSTIIRQILQQVMNDQHLKIKDIQFKQEIEVKETVYDGMLENELLYLNTDRFIQNESKSALIYEQVHYSYSWFTNQVNKIANYLISDIYSTERPIVILLMERSVEMMLVIHAVLKSGGTYLPLDPECPEERINYILQDSGSKLIITNTGYKHYEVNTISAKCLLDNSVTCSELLDVRATSVDIAYIIYTSGSTGKPKGVMVSHKAIYNRLLWIREYCEITEADTLMLKTPYTFDVSLIELLLWSLCGCNICILHEGGHRDPQAMMRAMKENNVSIVHFVPSMLKAFAYYFKDKKIKNVKSLRYVFSSGESLNAQHVQEFNSNFNVDGQIKILNLYGPTEAAVDVSYYECHTVETDPIPIGKAIHNVGLSSMDLFDRILPPGIKGQLVISGLALAEGYLNHPELTKEKFIFHHALNERMYKTGDCVYFKENKEIVFCGRMDRQVKLRGYRIELDEIKTAIMRSEEINDAEVVLKNDQHGEAILIAFIVPKNDATTIDVLKDELSQQLLSYMIPEHFIVLKKLPVNANGKTDIQSLMNIDITSSLDEVSATSVTETELQLYHLWSRVLGKGIHQSDMDFFSVGGDSLKAIYLIAEMNEVFDCDWDINKIFQYPTIEQQIQALKSEQFNPISFEEERNYPQKREKTYVVNATQRRLYFLSKLNNNKAYNITGVYKVIGQFDKSKVEGLFNALLDQHDILRTSYYIKDQEVVAEVDDNCKVTIEEKAIEHEHDLKQTIDLLSYGFELEQAPLLRLYMISTRDTASTFFVADMSHVIADGISLSLLLRQFNSLFSSSGNELMRETQYLNFSRDRELQNDEQKKYWLNELKSIPDSLPLKTDFPRPQIFTFNGGTISRKYDRLTVQHSAAYYKTTPSIIFLSALSILIYRQSGYKEFVIGVVVSGRTGRKTKDIIGPMINTLPLYICLQDNLTGEEVIRYVHSKVLDLLKNQNCPVDEIIDDLQLDRKLDYNPLFNILYTFNNEDIDLDMDLNIEGTQLQHISYKPNAAKVDLSLFVYENIQTVEFEYCTDLFEQESIRKYMERFQKILCNLDDTEFSAPVFQWDLLMDDEKDSLFKESKYVQDSKEITTIQQKFAKIVHKYPERVAIQSGERKLSYTELDYYSNCAAALLQSKGVGQRSNVGIILDNTPELIISILAVLKLGACYIPIDISTPLDRVTFIIQDSNIDHIITERTDFIEFKSVISMSSIMTTEIVDGNFNFVKGNISDLCYVIYTSGSTGIPKGCRLKQEGVINYIEWAIKQYITDFNGDNPLHFPMFTSPSVDLTVTSIFVPLLSGNTIEMYSNDIKSIIKIFCESQAEIVKLTPTHLKIVAAINLQETNIKKIIVGGEQLNKSLCDSIRIPRVQLFNEYGPTEATVGCMIYEYLPVDSQQIVPIGTAIDNMNVYLLDKHNQICLPGVEGELYITGVGLADGYTNSGITTEKFVEISIDDNQSCRMYRTGDYGYYLNNGNIVYTGRKDTQKKVRGYRVEFEEIEACLLNGLPLLSVYAFLRNEQIIVCFTSQEMDEGLTQTILSYARRKLPLHMVPDKVIPLKQMPILTSGKVDESLLSSLADEGGRGEKTVFSTEINEIQETIRRIWEGVLNINNIDLNDSFFDVGGNSILLLQLHNKIEQHYSGIELMDYFKYTTINSISEYIDSGITQPIITDINRLPSRFFTGNGRQVNKANTVISLSDEVITSLDDLCSHYKVSRISFIGTLVIVIVSHFVESSQVAVTFLEDEHEWNSIVPKMSDFEGILSLLYENINQLRSPMTELSIAISNHNLDQRLNHFDIGFILNYHSKEIILTYDHIFLNSSEIEPIADMLKNILYGMS